jgi:hypothetical protein
MSERFRTRWEYEDQLLNTRTNLFLVLNGLGAVAVQVATKSQAKITIAIIVLVANILWIICAIQSLRVIAALAKQYRASAPDDPVETLVQNTLGDRY